MTPEDARALEPGTTPGPWEVKTGHGDDADVWIESRGAKYPDGEPRQICETTFVDNWADLPLIAAAPDMRAYIAAQTWEYALDYRETGSEVWESSIGGWKQSMEAVRDERESWLKNVPDNRVRVVRRTVGPVEVVE